MNLVTQILYRILRPDDKFPRFVVNCQEKLYIDARWLCQESNKASMRILILNKFMK